MANTVNPKFKIQPGMKLLVLHAPADHKKQLGTLPAGATISDKVKDPDQIHWFVQNKAILEKELKKVLALLKPGISLWIYYPKRTSGIQTDLSRDHGWEKLLEPVNSIKWVTLISFNDTWSAFLCRIQDRTTEKKPAVREILNWIDPVKKTVKIPHDLKDALRKNKTVQAYFDSLAYSHRKEYVEWIVTAKKEETRISRIKGTIERLEKKWKNPSDNQ